jgi:RHS repeat-associated protein
MAGATFGSSWGGWRVVINYDTTSTTARYSTSDSGGCPSDLGGDFWTKRTGFSWTGPDGIGHSWTGILTNQEIFGQGGSCDADPGVDIPNASGYADDGSGFFLSVTNYATMTVYAPDGTEVYPVFKDANGNYFSSDANGNVIDTLGRTPIIASISGNNVYYDVSNAQGTRSRYTILLGSIPVSVPATDQFGNPGNYTTTLTVIKSIGLPNGASYQFGYESGTSGEAWGGITSVALPTGGTVTYSYSTFTDAWGGGVDSTNRWVTGRVVPDGAGFDQWQYIPSVIGKNPTAGTADQQTTVIKPSGDSVVYKFHAGCGLGPFANKEQDVKTSNGALLKQRVIDYSPDICFQFPPFASQTYDFIPVQTAGIPIRVTSTTFSQGGGPALTSKTEYDYTNSPSRGNPTKVSEWNFYAAAPSSAPDRIVTATYKFSDPTYSGRHINIPPTAVTLTDGGGNTIAQTIYTYDTATALASTDTCQAGSASQPSPAAPQHDYQNFCTTNTVRGNVTQLSKWLNTTGGLIVTTTNTYDDTGNLIASKDALSNTTTMEYSATFGHAYLTKVTNAKGQVSTKDYDFTTGLVKSETDANGQISGKQTKYTYDNMGRLTQTDLPDGGQATTDFNGDAIPFTITTKQFATPSPTIVKNTILDGLGRTQKDCLEDPEGEDCTDSPPDLNGRVGSTSNPHRATAAATDGTTKFLYDALDRTTSVSEPDGNIVATSYDTQLSPAMGETTTIKDETGRQRRTVTDAFGRIVEADEPGDTFVGTSASASIDIGPIKTAVVGAHPATQATGSISIIGTEGFKTFTQQYCAEYTTGRPPRCVDWETSTSTVNDSGTVTVVVNGQPFPYTYGPNDSVITIANALAGSIHTSSSTTDYSSISVNTSVTPPVATIFLLARTAGSGGNSIALGTQPTTYDTTDFTTASFSPGISGPSLSGGSEAATGTTVTDHGSVTLTVGSFTTPSIPYGPGTANTTASAVASALGAGLNGSGFTATTPNGSDGTTLAITDNTVGIAGNGVVVAVDPASADPADFPSPSFNIEQTSLANGQDSYASGLEHPYVTRYYYDLLDNLTCVEQHGDSTGSDCNPYIMSVTATVPPAADATSPWRIRRFAYDSLSRLRWSSDPESGLTTRTYDNNGNVISQTDARGVTINYSPTASPIDSLNRVTMITYTDGTPTVTYSYDQGCGTVNPQNGVGHVTCETAGNTQLSFVYDPMGRVVQQLDCPSSGTCYEIVAGYDKAGQVTSLVYPDGRSLTNSYSAAGLMTGVTLTAYGATALNVPYYTVPQSTLPTAWGYWPTGAMNRGTFGNGVIETTGYSSRLQMNGISDVHGANTLLSKSYGLYDLANNNNGNILSIADQLNSTHNQTYNYDSLNRIVSGVQIDNTFNVTYSYDAWGNMKQAGTSGFPPGWGYDVHNRIQAAPAGCASSTAYCYDAGGNLLNDGSHVYAYDAESRLKSVDGTGATYTYDADGHRVRKDTPTVSTEYFFFGGHVIAELDPNSDGWTDYIYGYGRRIAKDNSTNGTGAQYLHTDLIGSTQMLTDSLGTPVWQGLYGPFGEPVTSPTSTIDFQFAGMMYDSESSLNHTDFRQYSSSIGRWLTPDPSGRGAADPSNPQSWNLYTYVLNNPVSRVDPTGLVSSPCDEGIVAFAEPDIGDPADPCAGGGTPPPSPPDIDPCQGKKPSCYQQQAEQSVLLAAPLLSDILSRPDVPPPFRGGGLQNVQSAFFCPGNIIDAINQAFGTSLTTDNIDEIFGAGIKQATNIVFSATGLSASQFNSIQPGARAALNPGFLSQVLGIGPAVHIANPKSLFDRKFATFDNFNIGGQLTVQATAHIDSGNPSRLAGAFTHLRTDLFGHRDPCPR